VTTVQVRALRLTGSAVVVVAVLAERERIMPETVQDTTPPFIAVEYTAKVVFTQAQAPERLDLRTVWQQSQGSWRHHPVFHGLPIREVIVWLRGEDSDV
jgi:hypothetical protein